MTKVYVDPKVGFRIDEAEDEKRKTQRQALNNEIFELAQAYAPECGGWTNVPNWHWDRLQGLCPPAFYSMACYGWRRTIGMGKLEDRIARSQFMIGAMMGQNKDMVRDYGCGITDDEVVTAGFNFLHRAGVMVQVEPNNAPDNDGIKWRIEIDPSKIDWEWLKEEKAKRDAQYKKRGRKKKFE